MLACVYMRKKERGRAVGTDDLSHLADSGGIRYLRAMMRSPTLKVNPQAPHWRYTGTDRRWLSQDDIIAGVSQRSQYVRQPASAVAGGVGMLLIDNRVEKLRSPSGYARARDAFGCTVAHATD